MHPYHFSFEGSHPGLGVKEKCVASAPYVSSLVPAAQRLRSTRIKVVVFALAALLSGLAGILATMELGSGSPSVGTGQLFTVIPAAVIGGTSLSGGEGGVLRSTLGVFLLVILDNGLNIVGIDPNYQTAVFGAVLVIAIVVAALPQLDRLRIAK